MSDTLYFLSLEIREHLCQGGWKGAGLKLSLNTRREEPSLFHLECSLILFVIMESWNGHGIVQVPTIGILQVIVFHHLPWAV